MWELFAAGFSCFDSFNLSKSSLGLKDENLVEPFFVSDFFERTCSNTGKSK